MLCARVTLKERINARITHWPQGVLSGQGADRRHEGTRGKNTLFREKNSESWARTHLAVLLSWITGFRCYSGASDVRVHRQRPKAWYQLNTDTPHHGFRDYRGVDVPFLTQSAVLQGLTPLLLFISFPLIYSCLLCSPSLSSGTGGEKSRMPVSAYWCKWTFEMTEGDVGLSAGEDASELSEGPLERRDKMHACRQGYRVFTLNSLVSSAEEGYHTVRAQHQTPIKLTADSEIKLMPTRAERCNDLHTPLLFMHSDELLLWCLLTLVGIPVLVK